MSFSGIKLVDTQQYSKGRPGCWLHIIIKSEIFCLYPEKKKKKKYNNGHYYSSTQYFFNLYYLLILTLGWALKKLFHAPSLIKAKN